MKKIFMAFMLCLVSICGFGQFEIIGTYHNNLLNKDFFVAYHEEANEYCIQISGKTENSLCCFNIVDIDNFRASLSECKNKYAEWIDIAKKNNIKKMNKFMNIKFSKGTFGWYGTKWYYNFSAIPEPRFFITSDNDYLLLLFSGKTFESSSNEYITEKAYWVFSSIVEIEELEYLISEEMLRKYKEKDNLFK